MLPWIQMKEHGVEVRLVRSRDWQFTPEEVAEQIDGRTRLVAVSHVSYLSGLRLDLGPIARAAHANGALMLADVTQSLGVVPVEVGEYDFAVASTYKWLLGIHGGGLLFWNRARVPDFAPGAVGWFSVENFLSEDRFEKINWKPRPSASSSACRHTRPSMPWKTAALSAAVRRRTHRGARGSARY